MRALSDALPTGHRAIANPTLQLHFGCGRATPPVSHSHNWPSGRMQKFFVQNWTKSYFLPIKTPKLILTIEWYYRSMYCRSNAMMFFKMANLKAISSSATLNADFVTRCIIPNVYPSPKMSSMLLTCPSHLDIVHCALDTFCHVIILLMMEISFLLSVTDLPMSH